MESYYRESSKRSSRRYRSQSPKRSYHNYRSRSRSLSRSRSPKRYSYRYRESSRYEVARSKSPKQSSHCYSIKSLESQNQEYEATKFLNNILGSVKSEEIISNKDPASPDLRLQDPASPDLRLQDPASPDLRLQDPASPDPASPDPATSDQQLIDYQAQHIKTLESDNQQLLEVIYTLQSENETLKKESLYNVLPDPRLHNFLDNQDFCSFGKQCVFIGCSKKHPPNHMAIFQKRLNFARIKNPDIDSMSKSEQFKILKSITNFHIVDCKYGDTCKMINSCRFIHPSEKN
jgi:hypothetical protein